MSKKVVVLSIDDFATSRGERYSAKSLGYIVEKHKVVVDIFVDDCRYLEIDAILERKCGGFGVG